MSAWSDLTRVADTLRRTEMPAAEIQALLSAEDHAVIHRYLELHRERLDERLETRRRTLDELERTLTELARTRATRRSALAS